MRATIIIGLPGSGKTFLSKTIEGFKVDDVFKNYAEEEFDFILKKYSSIVITDPLFCFNNRLQVVEKKLIAAGFDINKIYFENAKKKALYNIKKRNDSRKVLGLIEHLSRVYMPINSIKIITEGKKNEARS